MKDLILVVDDNFNNLRLIASVLSPDYRITVAEEGEKAIKIAESKNPDLILLDVNMPGFSGLDVCKTLKQKEKTKDIPVIFLTAHSNSEDIAKGFLAGGQDYISKPFNSTELLLRINTQLELHKNRELLKKYNEHLEEVVIKRTGELKHLSGKLMAAQEEEKRNIARELHDEIGQILSAMKLNLQSAKGYQKEDYPLQKINSSLELVNQLINQVRSISLSLHPTVLDDLGFSAAIDWQIERLNFSSGVNFVIDLKIEDSGLGTLARPLFRILQESLNNIRKHSFASEITIELFKESENICLVISDNGKGFHVERAITKAVQGSSLGLLSMRERAELLGGRLEITSEKEKGTRIKAILNSLMI